MKQRAESAILPPFAGFKPQTIQFFHDLAENQNREWFLANKMDYEEFVRAPLQSLVADISIELSNAKLPLHSDPHHALFRINRDMRFSKDKRPYHTHASAALTKNGNKHTPGVLYIHIAPTRCFVAAGFFRPEPKMLQRLREGLENDPTGWQNVEQALIKAKLPLSTDDILMRVPRGFEHCPEALTHALKLKSWVVRRRLSFTDIARASLVGDIVSFTRDAKPLLNFGWHALE